MSEIDYARVLLATLEKQEPSDPPDYNDANAKPIPLLPLHPSIPPKRKRRAPTTAAPADSTGPTITITIKNIKHPAANLELPSIPLTSTIQNVKTKYATEVGYPVNSVKLLLAKRPVNDTKVLSEIIGDGAQTLELGAMSLGGAVPKARVESPAAEDPAEKMDVDEAPVAQGESGAQVLENEAFWDDLKAYLLQRVRDEQTAKHVTMLFREAWKSSKT